MPSHIPDHIAEAVLTYETFPTRFEKACNELIGQLEGGIHIFSTSPTWDLGRDGKGRLPSGEIVATCCSLEPEIAPKVVQDLSRLLSSRLRLDRLYFCSSQRLSEHAQEEIQRKVSSLLPPKTSLIPLGRQQLAELAAKYPEGFTKFYEQEIKGLLETLKSLDSNESADHGYLQLALSTIASETSDSIRTELYQSSLLKILTDGKPRNLNECARDISQMFRLAQQISSSALQYHVERLGEIGQLSKRNERYAITKKGRAAAQAQEVHARRELIEGRVFFRDQLERSLGYPLAEDHYNRIWKIVQEKITTFFSLRGVQMVSFVSRLLGGGPGGKEVETPKLIEDLAVAAASTSSSPEQRDEIETAIIDLLEEPLSPAFTWLVQLCSAFIALCSLGLEAETGKALARTLSKTSLVLDTDVLLSLLCIGEPNHEAVEAIARKWRALGGEILVTDEVLHETAYHAQISYYDFDQVRSWLPGTAEERLRLIENAFVRSFAEYMEKHGAMLSQWNKFVQQYIGGSRGSGELSSLLQEEYGIRRLPQGKDDDGKRLQKEVKDYLARRAKAKFEAKGEGLLRKALDKAKRDSTLYATIASATHRTKELDSERGFFLVSSSKRLAEVEAKFSEVGEANFVITVGMLVYLISLIPEVSLGIGSMRAFLFDGPRIGFSSELERTLLRVIKESSSASLPWAKRRRFISTFRRRLLERAKNSGESEEINVQALEEEVIRGQDIKTTTELLSESLNSLAAERKLEQELAQLRDEVARLRMENRELKKRQ